jgi:hypothetical protein
MVIRLLSHGIPISKISTEFQDLGAVGNGVGVADVDFARIDSVRATMPIESHRRF